MQNVPVERHTAMDICSTWNKWQDKVRASNVPVDALFALTMDSLNYPARECMAFTIAEVAKLCFLMVSEAKILPVC